MERLDLARRYFELVVAGDGDGVASLFTEDGVIDDFAGGHHFGRPGIKAFIDAIEPGSLRMDAPLHGFEEADRLNVYGHVLRPGEAELDDVRWVFHFKGSRVSHLCNSKVFELISDRTLGGRD